MDKPKTIILHIIKFIRNMLAVDVTIGSHTYMAKKLKASKKKAFAKSKKGKRTAKK